MMRNDLLVAWSLMSIVVATLKPRADEQPTPSHDDEPAAGQEDGPAAPPHRKDSAVPPHGDEQATLDMELANSSSGKRSATRRH